MSHTYKTTLSNQSAGKAPPPQKPRKNQFLIIDGLGVALLVCAALLLGGCSFLTGDQAGGPVAEVSDQTEPTATLIPTATATLVPTATTPPTPEPTATLTPKPTETVVVEPAGPPMIEQITFAMDATEDYEPIEPGDSFVGEVTEIHAIFEYSNLSPNYTWEGT